MAPQTLTIEEAADRLGVHYMTVYRYIRIGRLPAHRRDGRWWIRSTDLWLTSDAPSDRNGSRRGRSSSRQEVDSVQGLRDRLVAGDAAGAWTMIESALMGGTPSDVYLRLLAPCLEQIGDDWEKALISIADEHRATAVAVGIVGRLSPLFTRRGRRRPGQLLLAGAEGDPHAIPLAIVADHLRANGFDVVHLGADVPVDTLVHLAATSDLTAVGISASTTTGAGMASRAIEELHNRIPGLPVVIGGPAVRTEEDALHIGADGWAANAASAAQWFIRHPPPKSSA